MGFFCVSLLEVRRIKKKYSSAQCVLWHSERDREEEKMEQKNCERVRKKWHKMGKIEG